MVEVWLPYVLKKEVCGGFGWAGCSTVGRRTSFQSFAEAPFTLCFSGFSFFPCACYAEGCAAGEGDYELFLVAVFVGYGLFDVFGVFEDVFEGFVVLVAEPYGYCFHLMFSPPSVFVEFVEACILVSALLADPEVQRGRVECLLSMREVADDY